MLFGTILILGHGTYLSQPKFKIFVAHFGLERIEGTVKRKRMKEAAADLDDHFRNEREPSEVAQVIDSLVSASDFALWKIIKVLFYVAFATLYLPYAYIKDAPERFLGALTEAIDNTEAKYLSYFISVLLFGLIFFGVSVFSWAIVLHAVFAND